MLHVAVRAEVLCVQLLVAFGAFHGRVASLLPAWVTRAMVFHVLRETLVREPTEAEFALLVRQPWHGGLAL